MVTAIGVPNIYQDQIETQLMKSRLNRDLDIKNIDRKYLNVTFKYSVVGISMIAPRNHKRFVLYEVYFHREKKDNLHFVPTPDTGMKCSIDLQ